MNITSSFHNVNLVTCKILHQNIYNLNHHISKSINQTTAQPKHQSKHHSNPNPNSHHDFNRRSSRQPPHQTRHHLHPNPIPHPAIPHLLPRPIRNLLLPKQQNLPKIHARARDTCLWSRRRYPISKRELGYCTD